VREKRYFVQGEEVLSAHAEPSLHTIVRKRTRSVRVCDLVIGGGHPVVVQEMASTYTADVDKTCAQIASMKKAGCGLVRVAVPDLQSAEAIGRIKKQAGVPIIADVHFDYRLAVAAVEHGCDKLRINPGNIGSSRKVAEVVAAAKAHGIPIRVGVNSGSLEKKMIVRYRGITPEGIVESALREVHELEALGFENIVVSLKSTDIALTVASNKLFSEKLDYPLHIGITESGVGVDGMIRSAAGLATLLLNGIGDTVRVSLTASDRMENLSVCREVLQTLNIPYV
jgi:(E)-4-hydroxy-3-methylbut-2-enyl-diphosphate synthase